MGKGRKPTLAASNSLRPEGATPTSAEGNALGPHRSHAHRPERANQFCAAVLVRSRQELTSLAGEFPPLRIHNPTAVVSVGRIGREPARHRRRRSARDAYRRLLARKSGCPSREQNPDAVERHSSCRSGIDWHLKLCTGATQYGTDGRPETGVRSLKHLIITAQRRLPVQVKHSAAACIQLKT